MSIFSHAHKSQETHQTQYLNTSNTFNTREQTPQEESTQTAHHPPPHTRIPMFLGPSRLHSAAPKLRVPPKFAGSFGPFRTPQAEMIEAPRDNPKGEWSYSLGK